MIVKCPTCGKPVPWGKESPYRPFCSERCKLIDLGQWASGVYVIHGKAGSAADEAGNIPLPEKTKEEKR